MLLSIIVFQIFSINISFVLTANLLFFVFFTLYIDLTCILLLFVFLDAQLFVIVKMSNSLSHSFVPFSHFGHISVWEPIWTFFTVLSFIIWQGSRLWLWNSWASVVLFNIFTWFEIFISFLKALKFIDNFAIFLGLVASVCAYPQKTNEVS